MSDGRLMVNSLSALRSISEEIAAIQSKCAVLNAVFTDREFSNDNDLRTCAENLELSRQKIAQANDLLEKICTVSLRQHHIQN